MELRPLDASHAPLVRSLQQQEDVWEFIGRLPAWKDGDTERVFAVVEGQETLGIGGLTRSWELDGKDTEVLCAIRSDAQHRGFAKRACELILDWAFDTAKLERVIACIDNNNQGARAIATKIGMKELCELPQSRTVYVKYRNERSQKRA